MEKVATVSHELKQLNLRANKVEKLMSSIESLQKRLTSDLNPWEIDIIAQSLKISVIVMWVVVVSIAASLLISCIAFRRTRMRG